MKLFHKELHAFVRLMDRKLQENAHKGHWRDEANGFTPYLLFDRLMEEVDELKEELILLRDGKGDGAAIGLECADVANFALMIQDITSTVLPVKEARG